MALDLGEGYYDPMQDTQQQTTSIKDALLSTAKSMITIGALNVGAQWLGAKASRAIAKGIGRYATGSLGAAARGATSIGGIFKNTGPGKVYTQSFKSATKVFRNALDTRASAINAARNIGPLHGAVKSFTSVFKDNATFTGVAAKTAYKTGVVGSLGAYAIDNALGYGEEFYGLERKKWYDVPGKVGNFGKWMAINTAQGFGFIGATKALKAVGAGGGLQLSKVFKGKPGKLLTSAVMANRRGTPEGFGTDKEMRNTFATEVFDFAARFKDSLAGRTMNRAMHMTAAVSDITKVANNAIIDTVEAMGNKLFSITNKRQSVFDPIKSALGQIKKVWNDTRNLNEVYSEGKHPGMAGVAFANSLEDSLIKRGSREYNIGSVLDHYGSLAKEHNKGTLLDEIFGLEPLRMKSMVSKTWEQEKRAFFKDRLVGDQGNQLMDHVLNMRLSPGHYRAHGSGIKGGGVNLGMFDPLASLKRSVGAVLLKPYRIPLLKMNINIGDMFGVNTWSSDAPEVTFWDKRRSYKFGEGVAQMAEGMPIFPKGISPISTADVTDSVWGTAYFKTGGGKLAFFTDTGVHSLDWNRTLMFDYAQGARRGNENAWMRNKQLARQQATISGRLNKNPVHNSWLTRLLDPSELSMPGAVRGALDKVNAVLEGKNTTAKMLSNILGNEEPTFKWQQGANAYNSLRLHSGQDMLHILSKKGAFDTIADVTHATNFGDAYDIMNSSRSLQAHLREFQDSGAGVTWAKYYANRGIHEEIALLKAYPEKGKQVSVRGVGLSRDLNIEDRIRLEYIDDIFGSFWRESRSGGVHPLVAATPKLLERGLIDEKQVQSIKLFATLNSFTDVPGLLAGKPEIQNTEFGNILTAARRRLGTSKLDVQSDISNYVQNRKLRNVSIKELGLDSFVQTGDRTYSNFSPYISVASNKGGFALETAGGILESVTNMMSQLVLPFKKDPVKHFGLQGNLKYLTGAMLKTAAVTYAFKLADAAIAANPLLDKTSLESGVTGAVADAAAIARLGSSRVLDALGVTGIAKHLNGLMPGFTTSAPGAIVGAVVSRTMGGGYASMVAGFAKGAIGNRILSPFLPDFTKSYDQLEQEYSGKTEVPVMKSPTWLLGVTPWEGQKVEGYSPNWYVRTKSRWKETDSLYGSTFRKLLHEPIFPLGVSIGDFVDPYFMERKHYFSRPYPVTGGLGADMPLVGPLIAGTLGRLVKPQKTMHQEFLGGGENDAGADATYPFANPPPTLQEGMGMMKHNWGLNTARGRSTMFGTFHYSSAQPWSNTMGEDTLYQVQNFAGLKGFVAGSVSERIFSKPEVIPTLETAGRIASQARFYGDANLGGLGVFTEPVRRLIQKPDSRRFGINPIPNMMPDWLPSEFMTGDPFAKIIRGELRLPGRAYESTHASINKSMPARASMFGGPLDHVVQYFTGLLPPMLKEEYDIMEKGDTIHKQLQDQLAAEGLLVQAEKVVYDVKRDISGHVDAIIRDGTGGGGRKALEIKSINARAFAKLSGPKDQHVGQLNFYLRQLSLRKGEVLYVNRENPAEVKLYEIKYSKSRYERDVAKLEKARQIAIDVMSDGVGDKFGYSYSWLDRLKILADIAPYSEEFKEAKSLVEKQISANLLSEDEISEFKTSLKHKQARMRKYELYPNRFKGKIFSPDIEANIQSINEDIKAAAEYSLPERVIGAAWETFTNSNNFISNKFFAFKDPLEHYKQLKLYGKEYTPWDDPWGSFGEPALRRLMSKDSPTGGAYSAGMLGYSIGGGPVGAVVGGVLGTAYGAVNGLIRTATDSVFIPGFIGQQREINKYFDVAKYERYSRMAQLSEGLTRNEYQDAANATLNAYNNQPKVNVGNLFRATPYMEKPYIASFLGENDPKRRQEILKYLPEDLSAALKRTWISEDNKENTGRFVKNTSSELAKGYNGTQFDRSVLDPSVRLEDIKLKTINEAGLNAHDFGLGWNDQLARLQDNYSKIGYVKMQDIDKEPEYASPNLSSSQVRYAIMEALRGAGVSGRANVYINAGADDVNSVTVTIKRNRARAVTNALGNRSEYLG